jgi:hypothetical protein
VCGQIRLLSFFVLILSAMSAAGQSICFFYFTLNEGKIASYCLNPSVTGLIPSFARRGSSGFIYCSKTPPTSPCKGEDFCTRN